MCSWSVPPLFIYHSFPWPILYDHFNFSQKLGSINTEVKKKTKKPAQIYKSFEIYSFFLNKVLKFMKCGCFLLPLLCNTLISQIIKLLIFQNNGVQSFDEIYHLGYSLYKFTRITANFLKKLQVKFIKFNNGAQKF